MEFAQRQKETGPRNSEPNPEPIEGANQEGASRGFAGDRRAAVYLGHPDVSRTFPKRGPTALLGPSFRLLLWMFVLVLSFVLFPVVLVFFLVIRRCLVRVVGADQRTREEEGSHEQGEVFFHRGNGVRSNHHGFIVAPSFDVTAPRLL